ncbi:MAG TPA: LysR family transcriptional regulator [Burkholderiaceae bacterium]|nr:LysR family transcriptional regulator [Burkholderiaceae bacterium]
MNMTLNQLKAFRCIVRLGSFHAAAQELRLSQPGVSQRIRELEAELGTPLFVRRGPRISLTSDGHALIEYADRVLAAAGDMTERFRSRNPLTGRLRFGLSENFALVCLPRLLDRLEQRYPGVKASVFVGDSGRLSRMLDERELDVAIVSEPEVGADLTREPVGRSRLGWFARADHPLGRAPLTPADLARQHLMLLPEGSRLHTTVMKWFGDAGAQPARVSICNNVVVTRLAVIQGTVIGILPLSVMRDAIEAGQVRLLPVTPDVPTHRVAICYRDSEFGAGLRAFVAMTRELMDEYRIYEREPATAGR